MKIVYLNPEQLKPHPLTKELFDDLQKEDYEKLRQDIASRGIQTPLHVVRNGDEYTILAGHQRAKIARELGLETVPCIVKEGMDEYDAEEFLIKDNLLRKHYPLHVRVRLGLKLAEIEKKKAEKRQKELGKSGGRLGKDFGVLGGRGTKKGSERYGEKTPLHPNGWKGVSGEPEEKENREVQQQPDERGEAIKLAAKHAGVSHNTLYKAQKVKEFAEQGDDKEIQKGWKDFIEKGEGSISGLYEKVKAKKDKKAEIEQAKRKIEAEYINNNYEKPIIYPVSNENCNVKCDLLITDPPYMTDVENIEEFAKWLPKQLKLVKETGFAFVFIGAYPEELRAYLNVAIPTQILVWTYKNTLGQAPKNKYKLNWQAILFFRMPKAPALNCPLTAEQWAVQEVNAPDGRLGNRYHTWQKPMELAERLIRHTTKKGDLVLDTFAGTGTFLLAAAKLGRKAIGYEKDPQMLEIAKQRGCEIGRL